MKIRKFNCKLALNNNKLICKIKILNKKINFKNLSTLINNKINW